MLHITNQIELAIQCQDYQKLQNIGQHFGFFNVNLRRKVWPILLRCGSSSIYNYNHSPPPPPLPDHQNQTNYHHQIKLDVNRSFIHFKTHPTLSSNHNNLSSRKEQLNRILIHLSSKFPFLHYYQGLHDIATILLLVLDEPLATSAIENLTLFFVRDAMHATIEPVMQLMRIILPILKCEDKDIYQILAQCELHPYFCLSWFISWFSHDLVSFDAICRFFDLFLSSNPLMPIYAASAVVLSRKAELMEIDHEYPIVHSFLSKVPLDVNVEDWIHEALRLYQRYPLKTIQGITGWDFDENCAAFRFDVDFSSSLVKQCLPPDQVELLMESATKNTSPNQPESSGIYLFKPLPLVKRMGRFYIPVEGDASTLLLFTAMAIGVLSISVGMVTQPSGSSTAEAVGNIDALARFIVMLIQRG